MLMELRCRPIPLTVLAVGLLGAGSYIGGKQLAVRGWPKTEARIVEWEPQVEPSHPELFGWYANPDIRYRYKVRGRVYTSDRLNPSLFNYQDPEQFAEDTAGFAEDRIVPCWYNPASPAEAYVVNQGLTRAPCLLWLGGGLFLISAIGCWLLHRRAPGRQKVATQG